MAYQSLYRRYRPRRFAEVRGQADVVRALRNAVRDGRVGHAYLFSGPRGTGKTSSARILAKALNCTDLREGEPCGVCESCTSIDAGTSYDLVELDAASNNGVDAMRDLIGRTAMASPGRTKVYILDEVHMLTAAASAALLKTLEEPPSHVVFVLATTDPQKVLPTIRSRTQHFEFHLLPADELAEHVQWVIADAGLDAGADAVDYVLRAGGGSARDTLSALDQVVAAGGVPERGDQAGELVDALAERDTLAALQAVAASVQRGREPRLLGEALLRDLRDTFLVRMGAPVPHLADAEQQRVAAWAERFGDRTLTNAMELVGDALREMRQAPDPRIPLEVALLRLTRAGGEVSLDDLLARVERLEQALASGAALPVSGGSESNREPGERAPSSSGAANAPAAAGEASAPAAPSKPGGSAAAARAAAEAARKSSRGAGGAAREAGAASGGVEGPSSSDTSGAGSAAGSAPPPPVPGRGRRPEPSPAEVKDQASPSARPTPAAAEPDTSGRTATRQDAGASSGAGGSGLPDRDALTLAWADSVLPGLRGLTKAMYAVGRFLETTDAAVLAMPGEVHRAKCEERRSEVEAALARHFGYPVPVRLVVDGEAAHGDDGGAPRGPGARSGGTSEEARLAAERAEVGDLSELVDAPPDGRTPAERLADAFPGSELIDEP